MMVSNRLLKSAGASQARPPVRHIEWALLAFSMLVAGTTYPWNTYEDLTLAVCVLTGIYVALAVIAAIDSLGSPALGKFFLSSGMVVYFWLEAFSAAFRPTPFQAQLVSFRYHVYVWPQRLLAYSFIYLTVFAFAMYVGYAWRPRLRRPLAWCRSWVDRKPIQFKTRVLFFVGLSWIPPILSFGSNPQSVWQGLAASRTARIEDPTAVGWFYQASMFSLFGVAVLVADAFLSRRLLGGRSLLRIALALFCLLPFVLSGTRHFLLYALVPPVVILAHRSGAWTRRKQIFSAVSFGLTLLALVQLQDAARDIGWSRLTSRRVEIIPSFLQYEALLYAEYLVPSYHDYFMEPATPFFITYVVPRRWWPDKPVMQSWQYYDYAFLGTSVHGSVTPSIIGQYHLNWGPVGVVWIGLWMGFLFALADRAVLQLDIEHQRVFAVVVGMFYASLISAFRFYSPYYFYFVVFGLVGLPILARRVALRPAVLTAPATLRPSGRLSRPG